MERSQPKDQDLWKVLREESYRVWLKENPIDSNQKTSFQLGALISMELLLNLFFVGSERKCSGTLPQIGTGNLATLKPIKSFLNITVVFSAFSKT